MMRKFILAIFLMMVPVMVSAQQIVLYTDPWPPYYHEGGDNGFIAQVAREAFKAVGYDFRVEFKPWKRVMAESVAGRSDGILGAYHKAEREKDFIYTDPVGVVQVVFFKHKRDVGLEYTSIEDLKGYRIGTIAGYTYTPEFDNAAYLKKEPANKVDANILKLDAGRLDLFVESKAVAVARAKELLGERADSIEALLPPLQENKLYVLISRKTADAERKAADFNRGLKIIRENGTYDRIMSMF